METASLFVMNIFAFSVDIFLLWVYTRYILI